MRCFLLEFFMSRLHRQTVITAVALFSILSSSVFTVQAQTTTTPLRLRDAIQATLQHNPQLASYGWQLKALDGERQTAALSPEMRVSTELENIAGSGEFSNTDAGEFTLSLSSVIEPSEQRDARLDVVMSRQQRLASAQRLQILDVLSDVTRQFIAVAAAQQELVVQQQAKQLAEQTLRAVTKQVDAGRTAETEQLRSKAALARATIDMQNAQQHLHSERIRLSAFWAETNPGFSDVQADLFALPATLPLSTLLIQLDNNPDLAVLGDEAQLRAAELRQAQTLRATNLEWSAGVRRFEASDDAALVVGLSMPLGASKRASGAMTTAAANQANAEQSRDNTRTQLQAQLAILHGAYQQALNEVNSLRSDVLPALEQASTAASSAFAQGRYSYQELNLAQRELLDARLSFIAAAVRAQHLTTDIERLTGAASQSATAAAVSAFKDQP
jgi:cobalt-zinc-cadmium efflux system outer membrane protein